MNGFTPGFCFNCQPVVQKTKRYPQISSKKPGWDIWEAQSECESPPREIKWPDQNQLTVSWLISHPAVMFDLKNKGWFDQSGRVSVTPESHNLCPCGLADTSCITSHCPAAYLSVYIPLVMHLILMNIPPCWLLPEHLIQRGNSLKHQKDRGVFADRDLAALIVGGGVFSAIVVVNCWCGLEEFALLWLMLKQSEHPYGSFMLAAVVALDTSDDASSIYTCF